MEIKQLLFAGLLAMSSVGYMQAQEYYDVTDAYMYNTTFDQHFDYTATDNGAVTSHLADIAGWTATNPGNGNVTATFALGTGATLLGAPIPAAGYDGGTTGGVLGLSNSQGSTMNLVQDFTFAPGKYRLIVHLRNVSTTERVVSQNSIWYARTATSFRRGAKSNIDTLYADTWVSDTIDYEFTEKKVGRIQLGMSTSKAGAVLKYVIDKVELLRTTPLSEADNAIVAEDVLAKVTEAEAVLGEGTGIGAAELRAAIDAAQQACDNNATLAELQARKWQLVQMIADYNWNNGGATVTTEKLFVRGATHAFGRMKVEGFASGEIKEQGFCLAAGNSNPTINDITTDVRISANGDVYHFSGLTPATLYYMRAYVKVASGRVKYGDVIKFYTLPKGTLGLYLRETDLSDPNVLRITNAAKAAVDLWNNMTNMKDVTFNVGYNPGTPTADCSYGGYIRVGDNASYQREGTILHEMLHGVGVIPWADTQWSRHILRSSVNGDGYGTGYWLGERANEAVRFWENSATARLNGDYQHMWPYGINGASEDNGTERLYYGNASVIQALCEDGLEYSSSHFAAPYYSLDQEDDIKYYLKNEDENHGLYTSYLVEDEDGSYHWQSAGNAEVKADDSYAWKITFDPTTQYYRFQNVASGRYLSLSGSKMVAQANASNSTTQFQLMPGRVDVIEGQPYRGYWVLRHAARNPLGMVAGSEGAVTTGTFDIANTAKSQRWLILAENQLDAFDNAARDGAVVTLASVLDRLKNMVAVPHTEDVEGVDETVQNQIADFETRQAAVTSAREVMLLNDEIRAAAMQFLAQVTPLSSETPFDLTFMIVNPDMDSNEGWSASPALSYGVAEFYQTTFNINQTLVDVPAGTYVAKVKGFQRPGATTTCYTAYSAGNDNVNANFYLGSAKTKLKNIIVDASSTSLGGTEVTLANGKRVPNNMESVSKYFAAGLYENSVTATTSVTGNLQIGISCTSAPSSYWTIFDDFRLYYFGNMNPDIVTDIQHVSDAVTPETGKSAVIYNLAGQRVDANYRGIVIKNGKKVLVK